MSDQAAPEPTMEEILASIRRIISEDDAPEGDAAAEAAAESAPAPEPAGAEPADDVLELTDRVEPAETHGDLAVYPKAEPEPPPAPKPAAKPEPVRARQEDDLLVSEPSAIAAASAFGQLSAAISMPAPGRTLED